MSDIVCLGAGVEGVPILERAKALGHTLVVVDGNEHAPGAKLADYFVVASCYDAQATFRAMMRDNRLLGIEPDGVLCCAIDAPDVAAFVAKMFNLPGLSVEAAALSADKVAQKTALRAAGLPVPVFWSDWREIGAWFPQAGVVVKPVDSRGARGVTVAHDFWEIEQAENLARAASPTGRAMYERYIPGPQLSTESIVANGHPLFTLIGTRNYAEFKRGTFGPHPIEDGFDAPTPTRAVVVGESTLMLESAIDSLLAQACAALGWRDLTVKGDWIIGEDGRLYILELAARLSGGFFGSHGAPLAYGVDLVGAAVRLALGERVERPAVTAGQFVSQRYVMPDAGDVGRRVASVPAVKSLLWKLMPEIDWVGSIAHATYAIHEGDTIRPVTDHGARLGQAICTGATPAEAQARADSAVAKMKAAVVLE